MHRYRIVTQIYLVLSILNIVLAAPIAAREKHAARGNEMIVAKDIMAAMPKKRRGLEATPDGSTPPPSKPDGSTSQPSNPDGATSPPSNLDGETPLPSNLDGSMSRPSNLDAMGSPQHSPLSDGSTSSGYPTPYLSSVPSDADNDWLLYRLPRLSPNRPPSHSSSSGYLEEISLPESSRWQASPPPYASSSVDLAEILVLPEPWQVLSPPHAPSLASAPVSTPSPAWWQERPPPPPEHTESDYSQETFTHSYHPSSSSSTESASTAYAPASDGSLTSHYFTASDGLSPSHDSISEGSPSSPPENARFISESLAKKLKIAGIVTFIGGVAIIAGVTGHQLKHRDCQDS